MNRRMTAFLMTMIGSFARLIDLGGVYQPPSAIDPATAMHADWQRVGDDFRAALSAGEQMIADRPEVRELVEA